MKIHKNLLSIIPVLIVVGGFIYLVSLFTAIYPPLKKYPYTKSMVQLKKDLDHLSQTYHQISFDITDTTGGSENGYAYYITIKIKNSHKDNEYHIAYKQDDDWFSKKETNLHLIGAFDHYRKSGGYKLEDQDVKGLVNLFEKDFYNLMDSKNNTSP